MSKNKSDYKQGYIIFILAILVGLLINISANVIYDMFIKDNFNAEIIILALTLIAFISLIYLYHDKLHEPLAKFLQEFE